jgi:16S rRNA G527 N7-methylase RsmG
MLDQISSENKQILQQLVSIFLEKNTHINLSSIRDEEGVWTKHIEDSLITLPLFEQF